MAFYLATRKINWLFKLYSVIYSKFRSDYKVRQYSTRAAIL